MMMMMMMMILPGLTLNTSTVDGSEVRCSPPGMQVEGTNYPSNTRCFQNV